MLKIEKHKLKRKLVPTKNAFHSLAGSIIYQQISTKAGNSIYKKFIALFGKKKLTPKTLLVLTDTQLRTAGLSGQKAKYLRDLAEKFLDKSVDPSKFETMTDDEIRDHLVQVKGVGVWTADMFLIFALNRPNVLPVGDLGIKKGFMKVFNLRKIPSDVKMRKLAKPHDGNYTYLSLYLWQAMDD